MARRWTPQRFVMMRRIRVALCAAAVVAASTAAFGVGARKAVALTVNGETSTVTTYAMTVERLLEERDVDVRTHDLVQSSSGDTLSDHAVVTVRSAYQTTVNVDGEDIPFWTVADSADQLIGFFKANESAAQHITVNIGNVYNQLTGGMVVNKEGPVTVIADGKTSQAPNGKLPAASILDAKGIVVGKEDRVSVTEENGETILRVQRVTHGQETRTQAIPFGTQTVVDYTLEPGQTVIRQEGRDGELTQVYDVTYVDGEAESETLVSESTTQVALDQIIAVGPSPSEDSPSDGDASDASKDDAGKTDGKADDSGSDKTDKTDKDDASDASKDDAGKTDTGKDDGKTDDSGNSDGNDSGDNAGGSDSGNSGGNNSGNNSGGNSGNNSGGNSGGSDSGGGAATGRLWHPSVSQAQTYAAAAAAQRGWTGEEWDAIVWLWNKESGWRWNAANPYSDAYGIPQALPGSKMGTGWQDDGAVQIDWGLSYIAQRYGSPTECKRMWLIQGWY